MSAYLSLSVLSLRGARSLTPSSRYINFDGSFNSTSLLPQSVSLPCNIDFGFDDTHALVPNLGSYQDLGKNANGTVGILDDTNTVISVIEVAKLLGDKGHQHPHDAIFLANGDIVVCCWCVWLGVSRTAGVCA